MPSVSAATLRIRQLDGTALILLAYEVFLVYSSQYRANSIGALEVVGLSVLTYFVVRILIRETLAVAWLATIVGLFGASMACVGVSQFVGGAQHLAAAGLTDYVVFRAIFIHPISGWVAGENLTLLLLTLPFACAAEIYLFWALRPFTKTISALSLLALLPEVSIIAALLLSLSRAVLWSILFFFVASCGLMVVYRVITYRGALLALAGCCCAMPLMLACETTLYPGIFRAYAGHHVSQTRSTEGRLDTWHRSLALVREHPAWGVGSSNSALFLLSSADGDDSAGFTSRTFSLPIQLLAEKGLIGFACYSAFLVLVGWEFHRGMRSTAPPSARSKSPSVNTKQKILARNKLHEEKRFQAESAHRAMKCIFAGGLAAVLLRELTYSSLLEHTLTLAPAFILAALMCAPSQLEHMEIKPFAIAVAAVFVIFQWPYSRYMQADEKLSTFYSQIAAANFAAAKDSIDEAIRLWPWNARYYGWRGYLESQQLPPQCFGTERAGSPSLNENDKNAALAAADDYRHALRLNGRDAVAHHNLAWLEHLLGNDAAAERDWKQSVAIDPGNAALHASYGMFLNEHGSVDVARTQFQAAIEPTPSIVDSQFFTRYRSNSPEAADSLVKNAIAKLNSRLGTGRDPILEARLGKLYLYLGDAPRAETLLVDAARQLPNLPLVWFNLGQIYQGRGDYDQARIDYVKARTIDSSLAGPLLKLGELDLKTGNKRESTQYLSQAVQRWQRVNPVTSAHNNRLYDGPRQTIDDLLPTTLVWYISPCEASQAWQTLYQIHPEQTAYQQRTRTCEQLPSPHSGG